MPRLATVRSPAEVVLEVLAPDGNPIFEWAHETTPTPEEMGTLAHEIVAALLLAGYACLGEH